MKSYNFLFCFALILAISCSMAKKIDKDFNWPGGVFVNNLNYSQSFSFDGFSTKKNVCGPIPIIID